MKLLVSLAACLLAGPLPAQPLFKAPAKEERIVLVGNGLGERIQYFGNFETQLHLRFPDARLSVRNLCHPGDTAAYRPRAGRPSPWAFPGADKLRPEFHQHRGEGCYPSEDEWLTLCKADTVLAFFGFNESFDGPAGLAKFRAELDAFITHTLAQRYNGTSAPRLVLVSPIAFEDLSGLLDLPDGSRENERLKLYTDAMRQLAAERQVGFIDLFEPTRKLYDSTKNLLTINGFAASETGDRMIADLLADALYETPSIVLRADPEKIRRLVVEKDWFWHQDHRVLSALQGQGRRPQPIGELNASQEIGKLRQLTAHRDLAVWSALQSQDFDLAAADAKTRPLDPVPTNPDRPVRYLRERQALESFTLMDGFQIGLFASEEDFPDLANPVQMTFDNRGRLWVCTMPSYPHHRPGDPRPDDKILILEDTDGDHRADKQIVYADGLHLPSGFHLAPEGVYVAQPPNLVLLRDLNDDEKADRREILLHGFDPHDPHHAISAFSADASGSIHMLESSFLHSQVETPYGPLRCIGSGVWRFDPKKFRLERVVQSGFANPRGIAFDDWEQGFLADASSGDNGWLLPLSAKAPFGHDTGKIAGSAPERARPTGGAEFISSRHFPDELQGSLLVNPPDSPAGTRIHAIREDGSGFAGEPRGELLTSSDPNFRPCDLEFAPDGSLYVLDGHGALQSARDPNRDKTHGRIYRVSHKTRPLLTAPPIDGAGIPQLFAALKEPEYRTRVRARRELLGHPADSIAAAAKAWVATLDPADPRYDHHLCEALWATWAQNRVDRDLLGRCLAAKSHQARAAAVQVLRHARQGIPDHAALLIAAAKDPHSRVRLEAIVAASWLDNAEGARVLVEALDHPIDRWMPEAIRTTLLTLRDDLDALRQSGGIDPAAHPRAADILSGKIPLQGEAAPSGPAGERPLPGK